MTAFDQEPDPTERVIFPWSDAEADTIVAELIDLIGAEPQDVVEGEHYNSETGLRERIWLSGRKHMRLELQSIGGSYQLEAQWQNRPSPTELSKKLGSIDSAAKRMLAALGIEPSAADVLEGITPPDLRYILQG